jgi:hypothetical protein
MAGFVLGEPFRAQSSLLRDEQLGILVWVGSNLQADSSTCSHRMSAPGQSVM